MVDGAQQGMPQGQFGSQIADMQQQNQNSDKPANEFAQMAGIISDLDRRLRILEERYGNLRKKIQLTDQNLIESERAYGKELRTFNSDLLELKRSSADFDEKVSIFAGELSNTANKSDLKIIEKYLALWNPGMFVTRKELREYLKNNGIQIQNEMDPDEEEKQEE